MGVVLKNGSGISLTGDAGQWQLCDRMGSNASDVNGTSTKLSILHEEESFLFQTHSEWDKYRANICVHRLHYTFHLNIL